MTEHRPDTLFSSPLDQVNDFAFDEAVARVFPDMIQRSVPGYTTIIPMIGLLSERYAQDQTTCYDLGCSLGASTLAMRHGLKQKQCKIIAVDNAPSMIERCRHYIELDNEATPVDLRCQDIRSLQFEPCSLTTLNFTLQFLPPEERLPLLKNIAEATLPKGALLLSEKITFDVPQHQHHLEQLHWLFKKANGYSELEISQKRSAIEKVLLSDTLETHQKRLQDAGFSESFVWYQCFNFVSILALK